MHYYEIYYYEIINAKLTHFIELYFYYYSNLYYCRLCLSL